MISQFHFKEGYYRSMYWGSIIYCWITINNSDNREQSGDDDDASEAILASH